MLCGEGEGKESFVIPTKISKYLQSAPDIFYFKTCHFGELDMCEVHYGI